MFSDVDLLTASPAELLASVADMEPGLMAQSILLMIDRASLDAEDAITFLQAHERIASWWASVQAEVIVAAASPDRLVEEFTLLDPRPDHDEERLIRIEDAIREELASAVRWSPATAQNRIDSARLLAGPLRETYESLALGEITPGHVAVIVEAACRLPGRLDDTELLARHVLDCSSGCCPALGAEPCRALAPRRVGRSSRSMRKAHAAAGSRRDACDRSTWWMRPMDCPR